LLEGSYLSAQLKSDKKGPRFSGGLSSFPGKVLIPVEFETIPVALRAE